MVDLVNLDLKIGFLMPNCIYRHLEIQIRPREAREKAIIEGLYLLRMRTEDAV